MTNTLYSVGDAAKKLNTTRTTIYNKLKQDEFASLVVTEKGQTMLTEDLINLISESLRPKTSNETEQKSNLEETLAKVIETLTNQLAEKDKVIGDLLRLTENQQKLLGNAQLQQQEQLQIESPKRKWWQR
jgi:predicted transcriptional regulator